jgi:uncharacterized sporulation protein YeaH/YhbH (DUF444 family)
MFHFSDGENSSTQDNKVSIGLLKESIVPFVNLFGYVEVGEHSRNGDFVRAMTDEFDGEEAIVITSMEDRGDIIPGIQDLLGTGR